MEPKEVIRKRQSLSSYPGLLFWPVVIIALAWGLKAAIGEGFHVYISLALTAIGLFLWFLAWIKARMNTYVVFEDTVFAQRKFISRTTSEARIAVMRSINVRQSFYQRIARIGDVVFKSAGDLDDVVFEGIPNPEGIKRIVQQQQSLLEKRGEGGHGGGGDSEGSS